jgi:hypothetical protein
MGLSLEELKKQNVDEEEIDDQDLDQEDDDDLESEIKPDDSDTDDDDDLDDDSGESGDEDDEVDSILSLIDEDEDETSDVPVSTHIRMKRKLKDRNKQQTDEIERLKAEVSALKKGPSGLHTDMPVRPQLADFEDDINEYEKAIVQYDQDIVRYNYTLAKEEDEIRNASEQVKKNRERAVDSHYDRVNTFVKDSKDRISAETYETAEQNVRDSINDRLPGENSGDVVTDHLIEVMGEGSEKVIFLLGKKPQALNKLIDLMETDPTGLQAAVFVGQQKERLTKTPRRISRAKKPAKNAKGDSSETPKTNALKKAYDAAHKNRNLQEAFDIKREAKRLKIDTSSW